MTASLATRSKDFRERRKAKLANMRAMEAALQWIETNSTDKIARGLAGRTLAMGR